MCRIFGIDPSEPMLRAAQRRQAGKETAYVQGTGEMLPFPDASFDAVLIVTVLCFLANPQALLREAHRVMRPGGRLIIGELGRYSTWALRRRIRGILGGPIWSQAPISEVVGMCGDGANDAPPLRQPQSGIAVSSATDVAKAAAGMVLTEPGLAGIVFAIRAGRIGFQRLLTYTFNC